MAVVMPTTEVELLSPGAADAACAAAGDALRPLSNDRNKDPFVFKKLVAYGFNRNAYGARWVGLTVAILTLLAAMLDVGALRLSPITVNPAALDNCHIMVMVLGLDKAYLWPLHFTSATVRMAGFSYAKRLWEALAIWSGDTVLAEERVEKLRVLSTRHALGYWQTWGEAFHLVLSQKLDIETFKPGSKLHDLVVTMSPLSVDKSLLDRTEIGTVRWCSAEHMRAYGEKLLAETGDAQAAETYFRRALTIAKEQGECAWELRAAISLANLNIGRDRADDAGAPLMQACNQFTDGLLTQDLVNAKALLSQLGLVA